MNRLRTFSHKVWFAMNLQGPERKFTYPEEVEKINSKEVIKKSDKTKVFVGPQELCQNQKKILLILKQ